MNRLLASLQAWNDKLSSRSKVVYIVRHDCHDPLLFGEQTRIGTVLKVLKTPFEKTAQFKKSTLWQRFWYVAPLLQVPISFT